MTRKPDYVYHIDQHGKIAGAARAGLVVDPHWMNYALARSQSPRRVVYSVRVYMKSIRFAST